MNEILKFKSKESYLKLAIYYNTPTFLEILGVDRKEIAHSQFLVWLLQLGEDSNGNKPLQLFIKYLFSKSLDTELSTSEVVNLLKIETERGSTNRIDILLQVEIEQRKYSFILENKVYSQEFNKQTHRYSKIEDKDSTNLYYYLVPETNKKLTRENYPHINEKFTIINYQGILDSVISKLQYEDDRVKFAINEYIYSLSKSWKYYKNNSNDNHNVMALNQEHRELLNEFWEDNKGLIILALQAITEDDGFSENVQKEVQEAVEVLKEHQEKQNSIYCLEYKGAESEPFRLVDVVRQTLETTKSDEILGQQIFDYFLDNKNYNSFPLVIGKNSKEYRENKSRYGSKKEFIYKRPANRTEYACLRNWGANNVGTLKEMLKEKFSIELKLVNK